MKLPQLTSTIIYSEVRSDSFMQEVLDYLNSQCHYVEVLDGHNPNFEFNINNFHHLLKIYQTPSQLPRNSVLFIKNFYHVSKDTLDKMLEIVDVGRKHGFFIFIQTDIYMKVPDVLRERTPEAIYSWMGRLKSKELLKDESAYMLRNDEYLIKSQGNRIFKFNASEDKKTTPKIEPICSCSSRDLFNFGSRCGNFKKL